MVPPLSLFLSFLHGLNRYICKMSLANVKSPQAAGFNVYYSHKWRDYVSCPQILSPIHYYTPHTHTHIYIPTLP